MPQIQLVEWIREKYVAIEEDLDEGGRRRWAGAEARSLGWGGITAVAEATGISDRTIRTGIQELDDAKAIPADKQRHPGGGRRAREIEQPKLITALEALVDPVTRGNPCCPLRWTCKSTYSLERELKLQGYHVSSTKIGQLLRSQGYSLQAKRKTVEGKQHPDRDAQFEYINKRVKAFLRAKQPAISIDTKKKEPPGNMKNGGKSYQPKGKPTKVSTHDFPNKELGKAVPYGVYDIALNEAGVSIGVSHDTAEFAIAAIQRWWSKMGKKRYPEAKRLLITADCGGSNSPRTRLWRWELQKFSNKTGLKVELCHYPPGTSKWNKIEHRLFCHITRNWQGVPLESYEIVVNLIGSTKTKEGLEVHAWLDESLYEKSRKISDYLLAEIQIKRNVFHGEWNYQILPLK
ncbi:MAG: ISAzo13 family transposase [Candidatus Polarisedimenticolaceae bacterium]|nr:ISAzo13 family transposase [Candidatus Polarisedimenticolaceae bacterium]